MKRLLHFLALMFVAGIFTSHGQILLTEDFSSGTFPPAGWSISAQPGNWSAVPTSNAGGTSPEARLSWEPQFNGQSYLIAPAIDLSDISEGPLYVSFKHALDYYGGAAQIGFAYRADGGNWVDLWTVNASGDVGPEVKSFILEDDFPFNSDEVEFALFFSGNSYNIDYWYIDDVLIFRPFDFDLSLNSLQVPDIFAGETPITGTVENLGNQIIESFDLNWQINDGEIFTESFTDLSVELTEEFVFETTSVLDLEPGEYALNVSISNINGQSEDNNPDNNVLSKDVFVAHGSVQRVPMFEHFTSSTCPPCYTVSVTFGLNDFYSDNIENLAVIKYQMNWPGNGDPYYTPEGGARRNYYGVSGVPSLFIDGNVVPFDANLTGVNAAFNQSLSNPAFVNIDAVSSVEGNEVLIDVDIMPYMSIPDVRLHAAVVEKTTYENATSNGETEFHYVMMKMVPNANGTTLGLTAMEEYTTNFTIDMSGTFVEDMDDLTVVLFLQNQATKEIYQATFSDHEVPFSVDFDIDHNAENTPVDGEVNIEFNMPVSNVDETEITNENVGNLIEYTKTTREAVAFTASISEDKQHINILPEEQLAFNTEYQIELAPVLAADGTISDPQIIIFTTRESAGAPVVTFSIDADAEDVPVDQVVTIELNQEVRMADGAEITDENVQDVVMFHEEDLQGESVAFEATINNEKTVITVTPANDLASLQLYMIGVDELLGIDDELSDPVFVSFTTEESLSADFSSEDLLVIYPNPADSKFFVEIPDAASKATLRVFNTSGQIVFSTTTTESKVAVDTEALDAGIYFVEIVAENFSANRKIIISR